MGIRKRLGNLRKFDDSTLATMDRAERTECFRTLVDDCDERMRWLGLNPTPPHPQSVEAFSRLSDIRQRQVLDDLLAGWKTSADISSGDGNFDLAKEKQMLERHLSHSGLRVVHRETIDNLDEGDVVEIYDVTGIQIFRSWNVLQYISYSLADLLVMDWNTLYLRPAVIVDRLMALSQEVLAEPYPLINYADHGVPEYVMVERLEGHNMATLFRMKQACAVLEEGTNKPIGFVTTGRAQTLDSSSVDGRVHLL